MSLTRDEIVAAVQEILEREFEIPPDKVTGDVGLYDDGLGLDSLDTVDLVKAVDEELGVRIPDEVARKLRRLADVFDAVESYQEAG